VPKGRDCELDEDGKVKTEAFVVERWSVKRFGFATVYDWFVVQVVHSRFTYVGELLSDSMGRETVLGFS
jgi:hypothetical protein